MILQEGNIIYDTRNHKSYVVEIAGTSQAYIRQVLFGALGDTSCISSRSNDLDKKTIARDISTIGGTCDHGYKKKSPFIIIGNVNIYEHSGYANPMFSLRYIELVKSLRKDDGFIPAMAQNSCERIIKQAFEQQSNKTNKKPAKKAAIKKPSVRKAGTKKK